VVEASLPDEGPSYPWMAPLVFDAENGDGVWVIRALRTGKVLVMGAKEPEWGELSPAVVQFPSRSMVLEVLGRQLGELGYGTNPAGFCVMRK
jgi:hypothetical protein